MECSGYSHFYAILHYISQHDCWRLWHAWTSLGQLQILISNPNHSKSPWSDPIQKMRPNIFKVILVFRKWILSSHKYLQITSSLRFSCLLFFCVWVLSSFFVSGPWIISIWILFYHWKASMIQARSFTCLFVFRDHHIRQRWDIQIETSISWLERVSRTRDKWQDAQFF